MLLYVNYCVILICSKAMMNIKFKDTFRCNMRNDVYKNIYGLDRKKRFLY